MSDYLKPQTYETYETSPIVLSNEEFIKAIFPSIAGDENILTASFSGPQSAANWSASVWTSGKSLPEDRSNFFRVSTSVAKTKELASRKKDNFARLHGVYLDDIGTKIPLDLIKLKPTWVIETSSGNFQVGYTLKEPIRTAKEANDLYKLIISAGLSDKGANGPTTRLGRLPNGVNTKTKSVFQTKLRNFNPEISYTREELLEGLGIDPCPRIEETHKKQKLNLVDNFDSLDAAIYIKAPIENPVLAGLKERGLYKGPIGSGKHDITCPWVQEHTDETDKGTAYFEPSQDFEVGGFHCFHGHCQDRNIKDLLGFLGVARNLAIMRSTVRLKPGRFSDALDAAEAELSASGQYFQNSSGIVAITENAFMGGQVIKEISNTAMLAILSRSMRFERFNQREKQWTITDPTERFANGLCRRLAYTHLPVLRGTAPQPYLGKDQTLISTPGYNSETGIYGVFKQGDFIVPSTPTIDQARESLRQIIDLISDFPFQSPADQAAACAAILTATIRQSLPHAPMFHIRAPQMSSGKSYLSKLISLFATPGQAAPTTFPQNDDECTKLLFSELLRGNPVINFDNLTTDIYPYRALCTSLTEEFLSERILGVSRTASVSTRALFLSSGNNVGPARDMGRRCLTIHLDPLCEHTVSRQFKKPNLFNFLEANRSQFISHALTVIVAYLNAGSPQATCPTVATYGQWSDYCRQPLLWLGMEDPASSLFATIDDDDDKQVLRTTLHSWFDLFGSVPKTARAAFSEAGDYPTAEAGEFIDELTAQFGEKQGMNFRKFGRWLRRHEKQIINGLRFERGSAKLSSETWLVRKVNRF